MKMLVLGGNGFIGSHLVDTLLEKGHKVRVFDKYEEHYRKPIPGVEYYFGDFGNKGLVADALNEMDVVFHLVTTTVPKTSNDDPAFDVQSNVIDTLSLLDQCVAKKIKKFLFISSGGTVYGEPSTLPISENNFTDPECSYGIVKLTIEKYLALYHLLHGLEYTIVRPSNPYGERQNPYGIQGAVTVFLGKVAKGETIEIWGDGEIVRDYIYINDLVEGIYNAATLETNSRIFNIGSGAGHSLNEVIETIRTVTGCKVNVEFKAKRKFDIPKIYLDVTRAREELSWHPTISIEEGVKRTWSFIKQVV